MTFGSRQYKNGKQRGYLVFDSGKRVVLSDAELRDFKQKIRDWQYQGIERHKIKECLYKTIYGVQNGHY